MIKGGINLLPQNKQTLPRLIFIEKIKKITIIVLISYLLFLCGLVTASVAIKKKQDDLAHKITTLETQIKSLEKKESNVILLQQRASSIYQVLKDRRNTSDLISLLQSLSPVGVTYNGAHINGSTISVGGMAQDAFALGDLWDTLKGTNDNFSKIVLALNRTKTGSYSFSLEMVLLPI